MQPTLCGGEGVEEAPLSMSFHLSILVEVKGMVQTTRHRPLKWREREGSVEFRAVDIGIASK